jgi:hypothetical protein
MTQSGMSHDPSGETQAIEEGAPASPASADPMGTATLGTSSSSGSRSRR